MNSITTQRLLDSLTSAMSANGLDPVTWVDRRRVGKWALLHGSLSCWDLRVNYNCVIVVLVLVG